jgi:hypothetical protein
MAERSGVGVRIAINIGPAASGAPRTRRHSFGGLERNQSTSRRVIRFKVGGARTLALDPQTSLLIAVPRNTMPRSRARGAASSTRGALAGGRWSGVTIAA